MYIKIESKTDKQKIWYTVSYIFYFRLKKKFNIHVVDQYILTFHCKSLVKISLIFIWSKKLMNFVIFGVSTEWSSKFADHSPFAKFPP